MSLKLMVFTMHICSSEVTRFKETEKRNTVEYGSQGGQLMIGYLPWWWFLPEQSLGSTSPVQDQDWGWFASCSTQKVEPQDHKTSAMSKRDISVDRKTITVKVTLRLLPNQTFNSSLGYYTQWVHLECTHWFGSTLSMVCPSWVKKGEMQ